MHRAIEIEGVVTEYTVLPPGEFNPARTGGWVQMVRSGEVRTIYLDLGRLPLTQLNFDQMDRELLESWWRSAGGGD